MTGWVKAEETIQSHALRQRRRCGRRPMRNHSRIGEEMSSQEARNGTGGLGQTDRSQWQARDADDPPYFDIVSIATVH